MFINFSYSARILVELKYKLHFHVLDLTTTLSINYTGLELWGVLVSSDWEKEGS